MNNLFYILYEKGGNKVWIALVLASILIVLFAFLVVPRIKLSSEIEGENMIKLQGVGNWVCKDDNLCYFYTKADVHKEYPQVVRTRQEVNREAVVKIGVITVLLFVVSLIFLYRKKGKKKNGD